MIADATPKAELLGEVITFDVQAADLAYTKVRDALEAADLDPTEAQELTHRSAFSRACKDLKEGRAIDKVKTEAGVIHFQFTQKHLEGDRFEHDYECIMALDVDRGEVLCPENEALGQHAQKLLDEAVSRRNAQDITRIVQRLFRKHADLYSINPRKGVAYFVPEVHREFTAKVQMFLEGCGGRLYRFPVPKGTQEGNASVKEAVQAGLTSLLGELTEAVDSWDDTTRASTMTKTLEKWQTISHKVDAYAEYLESEQDRLKGALAAAKLDLKKRMTELTEQRAARQETGQDSVQETSA